MLQQLDADFPLVHAEADGAHRAGIAQLAHGAIAAVEEFAIRARVRVAMREPADVVAQQDVDARQRRAARGSRRASASPSRSRSRTPARTAAREKYPSRPTLASCGPGGHEAAPDLGGDHRRRLRAAQRLARGAARSVRNHRTARCRSSARPTAKDSLHRGDGVFVGEARDTDCRCRRRRTRARSLRARSCRARGSRAPSCRSCRARSRRDFHANTNTIAKQTAGTTYATLIELSRETQPISGGEHRAADDGHHQERRTRLGVRRRGRAGSW